MKVFFLLLLATVTVSVTLADFEPSWNSHRELNASMIPSTRIIQGSAATLGKFPYFVRLERRNLVGNSGFCGGSIIHINWILTAAHCSSLVNLMGVVVKHYQIGVQAGIITASGSAEQTKIVSNSNIHIHPGHSRDTTMNDIAILKTDSVFAVTANVRPVTFAAFGTNPASYVGQSVTVCGFGYTNNNGPASSVLRYTEDLKVISFADCQAQFIPRIIPTTSFCAQDSTPSISAICIGDSGGPVTMKFNDQDRLIGIVSYVSVDGCDADPQGHTDVVQFLMWINQVMVYNS